MITICPVCTTETLAPHELETNLQANQCSKCSGVYISANQYDQWLRVHGENLPEKPPEQGVTLESGEKSGAKFCPECKYILMKYKVGHKLPFSLDRCGHCGGMWFDRNEWDILKSRNLHDDVVLVFSQPWQSAVRAEEHQTAMDEIIRSQLGDADFNEIRRIRTWLQSHPKADELYAYLLSAKIDSKKSRSPSAR